MSEPIRTEEEIRAALKAKLSDPRLSKDDKADLEAQHATEVEMRALNQEAQQQTYDTDRGRH